MPSPPVTQTYRVVDADGNDCGEFRTGLVISTWWGWYEGDGFAIEHIAPGEENYQSSLEYPPGSGEHINLSWEEPLPEPTYPGAVGWIHKPGEARRWLVPA